MRDVLRRHVIDMVLATDMKQHFATLATFNAKFAAVCDSASASQLRSSVDQERPSRRGAAEATTPGLGPLDDDSRLLVMKVALKCSDLGHLAAEEGVHRRWVAALEEEFFRQGDREVGEGGAWRRPGSESLLSHREVGGARSGGCVRLAAGFVAPPLLFNHASALLDA